MARFLILNEREAAICAYNSSRVGCALSIVAEVSSHMWVLFHLCVYALVRTLRLPLAFFLLENTQITAKQTFIHGELYGLRCLCAGRSS